MLRQAQHERDIFDLIGMKKKIVIIGLGSIGKRHARLLLEEGYDVVAFRSGTQKGNDLQLPEIFSWNELFKLKPDACFITNPTHLHLKTVQPCLEAGIPVFLEKPIDMSCENLDACLSMLKERQLPTYVAYVLRFHPVVKALREELQGKKVFHVRGVCTSYLPSWRAGEAKQYYSAHASQGGGVILDVSHEFDLMDYLLGPLEEIKGNFSRLSHLTENAEDFVDCFMRSKTGAQINLHLNFLSHHRERRLVIDTEKGCYKGDLLAGKLSFLSEKEESWEKQYHFHSDDLFREQIRYFFDHLHDPTMMNNLVDAAPLYRKIIAMREGKSLL